MRAHFFGFFAALTLAHAAAATAPRVAIELRPQVRAEGSIVRLGHVAVLRTHDLPLIRTLVRLPVGPTPAAGQSATVERDRLAGWLQRQAGLAPHQIQWTGPEASRVVAEARSLDGAKLAAVAEAGLREWLARRGADAEVQVRGVPAALQVPPGPLRLQARRMASAPPRPRMLVWVDVWAGERFVRTVPVGFALQLREIGSALLRQAPDAHADAAAFMRDLPPAASLPSTASRHAPPPDVTRGQWAVLRSGVGAVVTEARVRVLQDGRRGERVRVRHAAASAPMMARVSGPGRLETAP